jgi:hypothetical protein
MVAFWLSTSVPEPNWTVCAEVFGSGQTGWVSVSVSELPIQTISLVAPGVSPLPVTTSCWAPPPKHCTGPPIEFPAQSHHWVAPMVAAKMAVAGAPGHCSVPVQVCPEGGDWNVKVAAPFTLTTAETNWLSCWVVLDIGFCDCPTI